MVDNPGPTTLVRPFMSVLVGVLTFILILVSIFLILVVLMQKAKSDGGVAAMGGGATEAAFGAETGNVLVSATKYATILFFVISFVLYLAHLYQAKHVEAAETALPAINAPAVPASAPTQTEPVPAPAKSEPPAQTKPVKSTTPGEAPKS